MPTSGSGNRESGLDDCVRLTTTLDHGPDVPPVCPGPKSALAPVERPFRRHGQKRIRRLVREDAHGASEELHVVAGRSGNRSPGKSPIGGTERLLGCGAPRRWRGCGARRARHRTGATGRRDLGPARVCHRRPLADFDADIEQQKREHGRCRDAHEQAPRVSFWHRPCGRARHPPSEHGCPDRRGRCRRMDDPGEVRQERTGSSSELWIDQCQLGAHGPEITRDGVHRIHVHGHRTWMAFAPAWFMPASWVTGPSERDG
jgi:hypothetical protein